MTKIAFLSTMDGAPWGGSEELWGETALHLLRNGATVAANVYNWPEKTKKILALESAGGEIEYRHNASFGTPFVRRIASGFINKIDEDRQYSWLDRVKADLVVISQGSNIDGFLWARACVKRRIPFVTIAHVAAEHLWPNDTMAQAMAEIYEEALTPYFVSEGNLRMTRVQLSTPLARAKIVRNPYNVSYDAAPPWPDGETCRLACVGRLDPRAKGQDILLEVLGLPKWKERPLHVTFFGHGGNRRNLEYLQKMHGVENVTFAGVTPDVEAIWTAHHALALPSRFEGLPLVIVEAMLCGRPCIVTDVAGNAELMEDNVSGFVADAPTAKLFDEALERAWNRRDSWRQIGQAAARKVRELIPRNPVEVFADELLARVTPPAK